MLLNRYRAFILIGLTSLIISCQQNERRNVGNTESKPAPKKAYHFDSAQGCYSPAIVNGVATTPSNPLNKHLVMVLSKFETSSNQDSEASSTLCTGTLVGPNTILTAAHCFPKNTVATQIVASINLFCSSGFSKQLVYPANQIKIHPLFQHKDTPSTTSPDYDIAIVQFDGILPSHYEPLKLHKLDIRTEMQSPTSGLIMTGYGRTNTSDDSLPELRFVNKGWDRLILERDSTNLIDRLNLISINQSDSRGGCSGDSGGPLLIADQGSYKVVGVASYIESAVESKLCEQGLIFYSYLPSYWDWISEQLK
jgi:hypothetical protein